MSEVHDELKRKNNKIQALVAENGKLKKSVKNVYDEDSLLNQIGHFEQENSKLKARVTELEKRLALANKIIGQLNHNGFGLDELNGTWFCELGLCDVQIHSGGFTPATPKFTDHAKDCAVYLLHKEV